MVGLFILFKMDFQIGIQHLILSDLRDSILMYYFTKSLIKK